VLFPCYNDRATIGGLVSRADGLVRGLTDDYEIVVVDDGSTDGSAEVLSRLGACVPCLRVVTHGQNRGYGGALRSGFGHATKDLVLYTDGDGQYSVDDLIGLFGRLHEDVDIVNGYKVGRSDPWYRKLIGGAYAGCMRRAFRLAVRDVNCDCRLIRKRFLDRVELTCKSGAICLELMAKLGREGARIQEVPVRHYAREHGRSQFFQVRRLVRTARELQGLWRELGGGARSTGGAPARGGATCGAKSG